MPRARSLLGVLTGFFLLALATSPRPARANPAETFERANAAFAAGNYEEAIREFRTVLDEAGMSAAVLYDLGNAELRAGKVGEAIVDYERALLLEPRNPDIVENLRQARRIANLPEIERGAVENLAHALTIEEWAWLATGTLYAACLVAAGLILTASRASPRSPARRYARLAIVVLGATTLVAWGLCWLRLDWVEQAVIVAADPVLRSAPYDSASVSAELVPGELVRVERQHESFLLIRTNEGKAGWVPASALRSILSDPAGA